MHHKPMKDESRMGTMLGNWLEVAYSSSLLNIMTDNC